MKRIRAVWVSRERDNSIEDSMNDNTIDIHSETFDKDFDEVGWDPEVIDDSDEEAAELYGFNN